jgi:hypothetical protein
MTFIQQLHKEMPTFQHYFPVYQYPSHLYNNCTKKCPHSIPPTLLHHVSKMTELFLRCITFFDSLIRAETCSNIQCLLIPLCLRIIVYFIRPSLHNNMVQCLYFISSLTRMVWALFWVLVAAGDVVGILNLA